MFEADLTTLAANILDRARASGAKIVTAESCTGGLVAACLTEVPGSSDVVERAFVVYSNVAKIELLGVPAEMIAKHGAVSSEVAKAMVEGAIAKSYASLAVSITGIAGPSGGTAEKPVGRVYFGYMRAGNDPIVERHDFGSIGRSKVRLNSVRVALRLLLKLL
jgi:nicotinamide-nucleotide amidase